MKKLTILFVALVMIFAALPAFAQDKADWAFYGSARMWTAWEKVDDNTPPQLASAGAAGNFFPVAVTHSRAYTIGTELNGDSELAWLLQGNSRFGANVKWGNIGGQFEVGVGGVDLASNASSTSVYLRLLYGTWNFGSGTLEIGQDYGTYFYLVSNLCGVGGQECNGIGFGSIYPGRVPQLALKFGGFRVSLEAPRLVDSFSRNPAIVSIASITPQTLLLTNNSGLASFVKTDQTFPRLAAAYTFNAGPGQFFIGGQYNTFKEIFNNAGVENDNTVMGWTIGAGTKLSFGPFYINATAQYGQNPNNAASGPATLYPSVQLYDVATDKNENSDYMAFQIIPGFKLTDSINFEGGFIWQKGKVTSPVDSALDFKQTTYTYYLQMVWSPTKNLFIIPEVGYIDFDKLSVQSTDIPYGGTTWFGIKWQINF